MAQSAEGPAGGTPPPKSDSASFVVGLLVGLVVGGTVLMLLSFAIVAVLSQLLFPKSAGGLWPFFTAAPAIAFGWWAVVQSRRALNFFSGALIGLAAGLLGGAAMCGMMLGGLNNMH